MRNPVRRNRNIGTARQGHGQANRLVIPSICNDHRHWWTQLGPHEAVHRHIDGVAMTFIVEATLGGWSHACSLDDICQVLRSVPKADWRGISLILLRQPQRKQAILNPSWGRLAYDANIGRPGQSDMWHGPVISLEAVDSRRPVVWSTSLSPDSAEELARLIADGHQVTRRGRKHIITPQPAAIRATQLHRTLLHEIGHWVDWQEKVLAPDGDFDLYFARARDEREAFAHRYADTQRERLTRLGVLPFAAMLAAEGLEQDNLDPRWFGLAQA